MDITTILLFALLIGLFAAYDWNQRRKISDGKALWWTVVSEPLHYVSDDPEDAGVSERAANARAKLEAHGNRYLKFNSPNPKDDDIWEYVYSATPETATRDFGEWQDWAQLNILARRKAWRQQKIEWNEAAAKSHFGGQVIYKHTAN